MTDRSHLVDGDLLDLGFAFSRSYLAMTSSCCCTPILSWR
jgi:hypothetical protein